MDYHIKFDGIEHALRNLSPRREDALTLSMLPSFASSWLLPRLPRFVAQHPQLEINLQSGAGLVDFERDAVDAALRYGPGQWPGVLAEHLFDEWVSPVASPALLRRLGRPSLAELGRWPLLGDPNARWKDWFEQFGGEAPRRYVASFSDSETLQRAALEGLRCKAEWFPRTQAIQRDNQARIRAVVDTLFARAERYVLVSTYVISDGQAVFARLAQRVRERPGLEVEMYLNIRPDMDAVDEAECVANFAASFARDHWPADVAPPALYYDPESLRLGPKRTTLHAKCVVVDGRWALVTSANFTEAAQERNIEAGVVLDHPRLAETLVARFRGLRDSRRLKRVP